MNKSATGLVLCGGKARRLGGVDKGLHPVAGRPMVEYVLARLDSQVDAILISANRNLEQYGRYGYPVVEDDHSDFRGPLAGVLAGLKAIRTDWLVTAPCDAPLVPRDLVARLLDEASQADAEVACVFDGDRLQPTFCAFRRTTATALENYLESGERKIDRFLTSRSFVQVGFDEDARAFMNLNTSEDMEAFEKMLEGH